MNVIPRRALFALPLVAPLVAPVAAAALSTAPTNRVSGRFAAGVLTGETIKFPWLADDVFEIEFSELGPIDWRPFERRLFSPSAPRDCDLAATLGIPHEGPRVWTDEEVAATLGISTDTAARDRLIAAAKVTPDAAPEQAIEAFRAARPLLDGKGGA